MEDILKRLDILELKIDYPRKLRGNTLASELLGISPNALAKRVSRGVYKEGVHFKKLSDRIYLWDRDTLIKEIL